MSVGIYVDMLITVAYKYDKAIGEVNTENTTFEEMMRNATKLRYNRKGPSVVRSIRFDADLWAILITAAKNNKRTVNGELLHMIQEKYDT